MNADEIISSLQVIDGVSATLVKREKYESVYHPAVVAAIDAVRTLEQVKEGLRGECRACKYRECTFFIEPCESCIHSSELKHWKFRWPWPEKEATK